ncbi:MAG: aa3-type cytochrome c oxidase subunit IV [Methyloceanibacter sp.]
MHIDPKEGHPEMDYAEHMRTYGQFCKMTLWTVILVAAIMGAMGYFLT